MRILIVDDDPKLLEYLAKGLEDSGMTARTAPGADAADRLLLTAQGGEEPPFDIVLLDVMMPGRSGWDLLEAMRGRADNTPVLFVTARGEVTDRVRGLELGADDYVIKPFAFEELLARIASVARRRSQVPELRMGDLRIDVGRRRVDLGGKAVELSPREFDLLAALARRGGDPVDRATLLDEVWDIRFDPETNVVDVHVARLRRKLGGRGKELVRTVTGVGYRLDIGAE